MQKNITKLASIIIFALCANGLAHGKPKHDDSFKVKSLTKTDCTLWLGSEGHTNDALPAASSERIEAALTSFEKKLKTPSKAMKALDAHCRTLTK